ncbi:MAG TPA: DUF2127 domain-containing protein [Streptosporangiaceae bacterium]|nr:DUF2127 domain-containing protein [Streptosporangiaceae bacterium]
MDWSLLSCGRSGHVTYAPAEPGVRRRLCARTQAGEAWRCLRCGTFVAGEPLASGPAAQAPEVRRGKEVRSAFILRVFAVERWLRALAVAGLAFVVWRFDYARVSIEAAYQREHPLLRTLFGQLGYNIDNSKLVGLFNRALTLSPATIKWIAAGLALYAVIEVIEGTGLWLARRWGEYFAMVATSLGLPYEIYDLARKFSILALVLFAINLALVLYLVITKRLFGVRGGKRAYEARLRSESIMEAAVEAAAADQGETAPVPPGPVPSPGYHAPSPATPAEAPPPGSGETAAGPDPGRVSQR